MSFSNEPRQYLVNSEVLPDIFLKVAKAKRLLETGEANTVAAAVESAGISRSAFYKYRDTITPFVDMRSGRIITFSLVLKDRPGALASVLTIFASVGVNVLTINQSLPVNGCASATIFAETPDRKDKEESLISLIEELDEVIRAEILAG
ncbi:MAG: ACT domain-containing protein [Oscillospiraceae bacterium]|nr:ACT domain-containing protein [Oscillospiraceae bacterium]